MATRAKQKPSRPRLVVDGDSFAHRAYHALPKTIRRKGNKGAGAIVGFANFLIRLYDSENPRAVLVGWDTLGAPTYRQKLFPDHQSDRHFDKELIDQLDILPEFVAACGFQMDSPSPPMTWFSPLGCTWMRRCIRPSGICWSSAGRR